jgi:MoxR-like ATPase
MRWVCYRANILPANRLQLKQGAGKARLSRYILRLMKPRREHCASRRAVLDVNGINKVPMSAIEKFEKVSVDLQQAIVGQQSLVQRLLIALLADGHLLVEGAPGLAKTRAIKALAERVDGSYKRIQFTPDLLPADITGTEIYLPASGEFKFQPGPLFSQIILADEINRAPAKVQSALLEAMAERQISVGQTTHPLDGLFLVMATQNPIEQEGTYPLPEAQLDRFLMHVKVDYPAADQEREILRLVRAEQSAAESAKPSVETLTATDLHAARAELGSIYMAEAVEDYLIRLVTASRDLATGDSAALVSFGASPRGTIALDACARAHAWLAGQDYVSPADIQAVVHDVLRHRILLSYQAEADGVDADQLIDRLLDEVAVP